ncbi:NAD(P)H-dependent oxidoreductase [Nafulsella turpanensis]|uniref:NAD(P)H-dependent oxidoreductase n=1 Tax=Nafulsella turpanensis TaxID=1265690 RepID=UPI0004771322|nr:NAD(P)H-dependent oxidoreductase [Nafulsella turpanensis]
MKVLIIAGHPRRNSFSNALAEAYREGALQAGVEVKQLTLADFHFNPNVVTVSPQQQQAEEDVRQAQACIRWADHLVFVYPTWWGTMPALLKGFLDRVFTPGFSFAERAGGNGWEQLLKGKTGQLITTMDTPLWVYRWILKAPGHRALSDATLQFCGVGPVRTMAFSTIKDADYEQRQHWLEKARQAGLKLKGGVLSPWEKFWKRIMPWIKALRLQFYPMTLAAYAAGALGAVSQGYPFNSFLFWLGYIWLFLLEVATVFTNDYYDFQTDKQNKFFGPFNGGSRVVIEGELRQEALKKGALLSLGLSLLAAILLLVIAGLELATVLFMALFFIVALGYTVPPLKLSYRGWGELDVAFTHSIAVMLAAYLFMGGSITDSLPWLLSTPLFLAILPSIILAGVPDYEADKAASKKTLAVRFGKKGAAKLAAAITFLAAISGVVWKEAEVVPGAFGNAIYGAVLHAVLLLVLLYKYIQRPDPGGRIDGLMVSSLTYLLWFVLIPLFRFW